MNFTGGLCQEAEDPSPWLDPPVNRWSPQIAEQLCAGCPVMAECADWAADYPWLGVVIAGRYAVHQRPGSSAPYLPWRDDPSQHPVSPATKTVAAFLQRRVTA